MLPRCRFIFGIDDKITDLVRTAWPTHDMPLSIVMAGQDNRVGSFESGEVGFLYALDYKQNNREIKVGTAKVARISKRLTDHAGLLKKTTGADNVKPVKLLFLAVVEQRLFVEDHINICLNNRGFSTSVDSKEIRVTHADQGITIENFHNSVLGIVAACCQLHPCTDTALEEKIITKTVTSPRSTRQPTARKRL